MGGFLILLVVLAAVWLLFVVPAQAPPSVARGDAGLASTSATRSSPPAGSTASSARSDDDTLRLEIAPGVVGSLDRRAVAAVAREVEVEVEPEEEVEVDPNEAARTTGATRLTCPARVVAPLPPDPGCR